MTTQRRRSPDSGNNRYLIIVLELLVIALSLLCVWLILDSPECPPCEQGSDLGCTVTNDSRGDCFSGLSCHTEKNQTVLIEYYSDNNFTLNRLDAQDQSYEDTITTGEIMRAFGEKDVRGKKDTKERFLPGYEQYLCLVASNATEASCIRAAIFW